MSDFNIHFRETEYSPWPEHKAEVRSEREFLNDWHASWGPKLVLSQEMQSLVNLKAELESLREFAALQGRRASQWREPVGPNRRMYRYFSKWNMNARLSKKPDLCPEQVQYAKQFHAQLATGRIMDLRSLLSWKRSCKWRRALNPPNTDQSARAALCLFRHWLHKNPRYTEAWRTSRFEVGAKFVTLEDLQEEQELAEFEQWRAAKAASTEVTK